MDTKELIETRQSTHGEYTENARCTWEIMELLQKERNWNMLSYYQKHGLYMIVHKIARLMDGDPDFPDHWDDIAGYAKITADRLPSRWPVKTAAPEVFEEHAKKASGLPSGFTAGVIHSIKQNEMHKPGTPEDGGHHAFEEDHLMLYDGLTVKPSWGEDGAIKLIDPDTRIIYFIVNRDVFSEGACEHLRKLPLKINSAEWKDLPPYYRIMYYFSDAGQWKLFKEYVVNWGTK